MVVHPFFVCAKNGRQKSAEKDKLKRLPHGIPASRGHVVAFHRASRPALPFIRPQPSAFRQIFFGEKRSVMSVDDIGSAEKLSRGIIISLCPVAYLVLKNLSPK